MQKTCTTQELRPGMITQEQICTKSGQVIISPNTALTDRLISRMKFYGIRSALVEIPESSVSDEPPVFQEAKTPVQAPSYSQKIVRSKEFQTFQLDYSKVLAEIKADMDGYVFHNQTLTTDTLLSDLKVLYSSCKTSLELFDMLHNMRSVNDSIYAHSLNVALISRRIGKWIKLSPEELDQLTLCGLLHDIGKLKIPEEILNKPGKYTDEEFALVKRHPIFGYELLKPLPLDERIKQAALSHHERCDGSGYPSGYTGSLLGDFTMIISIADVYDAMTAARSYRAPLCPFQVIANFEREGLSKYNPQYIMTFLTHIANTYQNNRVLLSDGRPADIVMLNNNHLSQPIIKLMDGTCIDLSTDTSLHIQSLM